MPKLLTHPHNGVQQLLILCAVIYTPDLMARDFDHSNLVQPIGGLAPLTKTPTSVAFVGELAEGLQYEDVEAAMTTAAKSWSDVSCSTAQLKFMGRKDLDSLSAEDVVVRFASPADEECLPEGFLGFTVPCRGHRTVLLSTSNIRWANVASPFDRADPLTVDTTAVITHEFGHVLGLGHDDEDARNTMTTRYLGDGGQATLSAADKLALCELYPAKRSECATQADCPAGHPCVRLGDVAVCDDERGEPGDYCGAELLICSFACEISSAPTQTGYCTNPCAQQLDCVNGMICVDQQCSMPTVVQDGGCQTSQGPFLWWAFMGTMLWWRRSLQVLQSWALFAFRSQNQS